MNIKKIGLSCIILAKNEEKNIERAIRSVDFCDEVIMIDDYSEDSTVEKAKTFGATVYKRELHDDFASQRNYGMKMARGSWILFIDADEEVTKELAGEIENFVCDNTNSFIQAYYIKRRDIFWGRELRYGEVGSMRLVRLVRKKSGTWRGAVHEKFYTYLKTSSLKNNLLHYPHQLIAEFLSEVNRYSTIRARELYSLGKTSSILSIIFYPLGKFILNYFFRLGFLDGSPGFVYAFMMSFHSFLVRAKLFLIQHKK